MAGPAEPSRRQRRLIVAALLVGAAVLNCRGITDRSSVMLGGDMARYMMNGAFVYDLIARGGASSYGDLVGYAEEYYARYPALSLGHHPPLPFVSVVPFYAVFGVSVLAARLNALCWFLLAVWAFHALGIRLLGWRVATWAAALFVTNATVLRYGRRLLSEMPMLALVLLSLYLLVQFADTHRRRYLGWFLLAAGASFYAKQLAIFALPLYGAILLLRWEPRGAGSRRPWLVILAMALVAVPMLAMTILLAPSNMDMVLRKTGQVLGGTNPLLRISRIVGNLIWDQVSVPALVAALLGLGVLLFRRPRQAAFALGWWLSFAAGSTFLVAGIEPGRYAFGAVPAYCLSIASLSLDTRRKTAMRIATAGLAALLAWQVWLIRGSVPTGAGGYEDAAVFALAESNAPVILYDSWFDTGYFIFFVRQHDPAMRHVVLRSDKVLPARAEDEPAVDPAAFYTTLRTFGIQFIVVEQRPPGAPKQSRLQEELLTGPFVERWRMPVRSSERAVAGAELVVYEYLNAGPPDREAELDIDLPRGNREIALKLGDLIGRD